MQKWRGEWIICEWAADSHLCLNQWTSLALFIGSADDQLLGAHELEYTCLNKHYASLTYFIYSSFMSQNGQNHSLTLKTHSELLNMHAKTSNKKNTFISFTHIHAKKLGGLKWSLSEVDFKRFKLEAGSFILINYSAAVWLNCCTATSIKDLVLENSTLYCLVVMDTETLNQESQFKSTSGTCHCNGCILAHWLVYLRDTMLLFSCLVYRGQHCVNTAQTYDTIYLANKWCFFFSPTNSSALLCSNPCLYFIMHELLLLTFFAAQAPPAQRQYHIK